MSNDTNITSDITEEGMEYRKWTRSNHKFKPGMCSRCQRTDLTIDTDVGIIKCNYCNDWAWLDDAVDSCCWNAYNNKCIKRRINND
jgi:hypothetical protein